MCIKIEVHSINAFSWCLGSWLRGQEGIMKVKKVNYQMIWNSELHSDCKKVNYIVIINISLEICLFVDWQMKRRENVKSICEWFECELGWDYVVVNFKWKHKLELGQKCSGKCVRNKKFYKYFKLILKCHHFHYWNLSNVY
jgi:hypothetical protein